MQARPMDGLENAVAQIVGTIAMTRLGKALAAYQQKFDVENKAMAREIGLSESTLTRVKQGKMPDAEGLAKIIMWLVKP